MQVFQEKFMRALRMLALTAALAGGLSSVAFAQDPLSAAIGTAGNIAGAAIGTAGVIAGDAVVGTGEVIGAYPYGPYGRPCPRHYRFYEGACYRR
jgi:hypothetical protein